MRIYYRLLSVVWLLTLLAGSVTAAPLRPAHAQHAMVASVHELASSAGVQMMQAGRQRRGRLRSPLVSPWQ